MGLVILDGGMGQELARRGLADGPLWSTSALLDSPAQVRAVHDDYVAAGADVITTATYAVSAHRFAAAGAQLAVEDAVAIACELAADAAAAGGRPVRIAGSVGPVRGSYAPDRVPDDEGLRDELDRIVAAMAGHVDVVLAETCTTVREARVAVEVAREHGLPAWASWTVQGSPAPDVLPDGTPLADAVAAVDAEAHLLNCCPPERMDLAVPHLAAAGATVGAYANGFAEVPAGWSLIDGDPLPPGRDDLDPTAYTAHVRRWVAAGATIVGGCCEVGPAHIRHLAHALANR